MSTVRNGHGPLGCLEDQVRELRAALEDTAEAIGRTDRAGELIDVNRAFAEMFGYRAEELLGRAWDQMLSVDDRPQLRADMRAAISGKTERQAVGVRKDGSTFGVHVALVPLFDRGARRKHLRGHYLFIRDLTERQRMQDQLIFAARMAAVGTLAAGVAHEINNPLAYIMANIDFTRRQLVTLAGQLGLHPGSAGDVGQSLDEVDEALGEARQGADRVRNIVRDLKVFGRGNEEARGPVALRRVLDASINIAWNEIRHRARLVKDYADVPMVEADESRLGQVFLNLLLNAAQAIPEGETERNEIRVSTRTDRDGRAVVEVRDTGPGIAADIVARIFDPFFTTKPEGGTGLGLWICKGILAALGGEVTVESQVGRGSLFRVTLPAAPLDARPVPAIRRGEGTIVDAERRGERVLVIDDEPMILGALKRALGADYQVTCAGDGRSALDRFVAGERFDVVLCDLMMPELTGMDLHGELARIAPAQLDRMIFITGGAFTPKAREFLDRVPNARVDKPVDVQSLRALIRNLLLR
jgi:PAS domain S-box-containing protein